MSTATAEHVDSQDEAHDHPSDRKYVQVAIILAIVTALEVATYWMESVPGEILIPVLMMMMIYKFFYVAAWFMHLKFDSPMFTKFFVAGLILATIVYGITLTVFEFWHKG